MLYTVNLLSLVRRKKLQFGQQKKYTCLIGWLTIYFLLFSQRTMSMVITLRPPFLISMIFRTVLMLIRVATT